MMRRLIVFILLLILPLVVLFGFRGNDEKITEGLPHISEKAIDIAKEQIRQNDNVKDAAIVVEGNYIALAIVMNNFGNEKYAKEIGEQFAKTFGDVIASLNDELAGTSNNQLGGIYNHYNLSLAVANDAEEVIAAGTKATNVNSITWQKIEMNKDK